MINWMLSPETRQAILFLYPDERWIIPTMVLSNHLMDNASPSCTQESRWRHSRMPLRQHTRDLSRDLLFLHSISIDSRHVLFVSPWSSLPTHTRPTGPIHEWSSHRPTCTWSTVSAVSGSPILCMSDPPGHPQATSDKTRVNLPILSHIATSYELSRNALLGSGCCFPIRPARDSALPIRAAQFLVLLIRAAHNSTHPGGPWRAPSVLRSVIYDGILLIWLEFKHRQHLCPTDCCGSWNAMETGDEERESEREREREREREGER